MDLLCGNHRKAMVDAYIHGSKIACGRDDDGSVQWRNSNGERKKRVSMGYSR